jgi:hypothetical protein
MSWKTIPGYDNYMINHNGKLKNVKRNKIVKGSLNEEGYRRVTLSRPGCRRAFYVHRIVASVFVDNPFMYNEVHHINGKRDDNRSCNLRWVTHFENIQFIYNKMFGLVTSKYKNTKEPIPIK